MKKYVSYPTSCCYSTLLEYLRLTYLSNWRIKLKFHKGLSSNMYNLILPYLFHPRPLDNMTKTPLILSMERLSTVRGERNPSIKQIEDQAASVKAMRLICKEEGGITSTKEKL